MCADGWRTAFRECVGMLGVPCDGAEMKAEQCTHLDPCPGQKSQKGKLVSKRFRHKAAAATFVETLI